MASMTIRDLDERLKARLRVRKETAGAVGCSDKSF